jgi:polyhydroxyalkanoate synthase
MQAKVADAKPEEMARVYHDVAERAARILGDFAHKHVANSVSAAVSDELGIAKAYMDLYSRMLSNPMALAAFSANMMLDYMQLWHSSWMKLLGFGSRPVAEPAKGDARFRDEDWNSNFLFDYVKQSYLIAARHIQHAVSSVEGLPEESQKKVAFFTRQYVDALAPSNFVLTNPQVLRETLASGGQNLVKGLNNLLEDVTRGGGDPIRLRMTDESAFQLGVNLATTPGKVVFQNDLLQLIQYYPANGTVFRRPLLVVPPWINKYYILDLREKNSFAKWAVEQGHTVFMVSWVNPDEKLAHKRFEDYLVEGMLAALDAIEKATGEREVNAIGYCLGGTLLACTLGCLAQKRQARIASATFFASMIDFEEAGELEVFIDEQQVAALEKRMQERGYLEGSEMAATFNMLRANDLIWSFVVNNYLLGRDPFPFDLLYWNSDSTRMPAAMHSYYLRNLYMKNLLAQPGGLELAGAAIDLGRVRTPLYFASTLEDHIAPWRSTYKGAKLFPGLVRFVLGGSGHIAGIVNPPAARKYSYWTRSTLPEDPEEWLKGASQHPGSWWPDWGGWIAPHGGNKVAARIPGKGALKAIEDAPGSYARMRVDKSLSR